MKAWVMHGIGDLRLETVSEPVLAEGEVLVSVKAVGICGSDIPRIYKTGAYSYPLIPGHEFSGTVRQTGAGTDPGWVGKRVGVFPLIPCRKCVPCQNEQYELCRNYSYLGSRRNGGFAEYVAVPVENLIELPDNVSFEEAALLEPMAVAVHAMRRIVFDGMENVAVCGLGTIGILLVMFLVESGVKNILVIGNKDSQRQSIMRLGLPETDYCDSRTQDACKWLMDRTEGVGVRAFFECVGRNETVSLAVDSSAPGGRICLVGNPYSDMVLEKRVYWKILRNQLVVTGTWNSSFVQGEDDDWHYVLNRLTRRRVTPEDLITHRYTLEDVKQGFHIMRDKTEEYIKIMAVPGKDG